MERYVAKIIAIIISFVLPFFFTMLPYSVHGYISSKGKAGERVITYLMCFGGGIFFGTYLLHMGPEVRLILGVTLLEPNNILYPIPDFVIGLGFFFVLFLEKVVMRVNKRRNERKRQRQQDNCAIYQQGGGAKGGRVCENCLEHLPCAGLTVVAVHEGAWPAVTEKARTIDDIFTATEDEVTEFKDAFATKVIDICRGKDELKVKCSDAVQSDKCSLGKHSHYSSSDSSDDLSHDHSNHHDGDAHHHHGHSHDGGDGEESDHHNMRSLILVMAISLHHLFEGLTVGLQSTIPLLVTLMFAIMCHECIISFSVGLTFTKCKYTFQRHLVTALVVCLIMPFGEAIGTILSEVGSGSTTLDMVSGFLQAFSAGTFIFVTFFEILGEEISPHDTSFGKVLSAFIGFIVMAGLMLIPEEPAISATDLTTVAAWSSTLPIVL